MVPLKGPQKYIQENDAFNFYLSQLRIKIEQAFGFLTNKWRILRKSLGSNINAAVKLLHACSKLHNFCINERISLNEQEEVIDLNDEETIFISASNTRLGYVPSDISELSQSRRYVRRNESSTSFDMVADYSLRDQLIETRIKRHNWTRPEYNLRRNANIYLNNES